MLDNSLMFRGHAQFGALTFLVFIHSFKLKCIFYNFSQKWALCLCGLKFIFLSLFSITKMLHTKHRVGNPRSVGINSQWFSQGYQCHHSVSIFSWIPTTPPYSIYAPFFFFYCKQKTEQWRIQAPTMLFREKSWHVLSPSHKGQLLPLFPPQTSHHWNSDHRWVS